jgi:N-acetyl-anhydromuramyl-L-alanine amidase AmpD
MAAPMPPIEWVGPTPNRDTDKKPRWGIVIHAMYGTYEGSIAWNKRGDIGDRRASAHFYIRRSDGHIGQLVSENEAAWGSLWAVRAPYQGWQSFHIEHQDDQKYPTSPWMTEPMLHSSAKLAAYLCTKYDISIDREHIRGHYQMPSAGKDCPGRFFPWDRYMKLVRQYADVKPPFELKMYNLVHNTPWGKERAQLLAREGNTRAGKELFAAAGGAEAVEYAGREAALNQPAGAMVAVVVGEEAKAALEAEGRGALKVSSEPGGKRISDVWDGGTTLELFFCMKEIDRREPSLKEGGLLKAYVDEYMDGTWPKARKISDLWGIPKGWLHWEWNVERPPRYAPYQHHWGVDVAPGDVTPHKPHGPATYKPEDGRWAIRAPLRGTVVRSHNNGEVSGFFNDTLVAYDTSELRYPADIVYVLYGHLKPFGLLPTGKVVNPGDTIGHLGNLHLSLGEIIHTHVQVWWNRTDAVYYNHHTTRDPMVLWEAIQDASDVGGGDGMRPPNSLLGKPLATKQQCHDLAEENGAPSYVREWVDLDWQWGGATGIRPDVLFAQEMLETDFGKFTGKVPREYRNVAGIKIKDPSPFDVREDHEKFESWSEGVRAHANHLCAYAGLKPVKGPDGKPVHDRYFVVAALSWAGTVKTIEGLSGRYAPRHDYHVLLRDSFLKPMGVRAM